MAPACCTRGIVGGGGCPPPVSPRCTGHDYARSVLSWRSTTPPGHYTSQLGSALTPPSLGISSGNSWACHPYLPLLPLVLEFPLPLRSGFFSTYPVTPCQVFPALGEYDPIPLYLLVVPPHPLHTPSIGFVCLYPDRPAWMAYHPNCFSYICLQPHPIK